MKLSICLLLLLILSGCADHVSFDQASGIPKVGFLHGFWHGIIFPIAWVISLFDDSTAIYAVYNNGGWYDFGFFLGVGGFSASLFASKDDKKKKV
ncbi:hypothetical protein BVX99_01305 [bacterium F16]|nr:hypothetical protein BVX99_01305 [bacterium F16]